MAETDWYDPVQAKLGEQLSGVAATLHRDGRYKGLQRESESGASSRSRNRFLFLAPKAGYHRIRQ